MHRPPGWLGPTEADYHAWKQAQGPQPRASNSSIDWDREKEKREREEREKARRELRDQLLSIDDPIERVVRAAGRCVVIVARSDTSGGWRVSNTLHLAEALSDLDLVTEVCPGAIKRRRLSHAPGCPKSSAVARWFAGQADRRRVPASEFGFLPTARRWSLGRRRPPDGVATNGWAFDIASDTGSTVHVGTDGRIYYGTHHEEPPRLSVMGLALMAGRLGYPTNKVQKRY